MRITAGRLKDTEHPFTIDLEEEVSLASDGRLPDADRDMEEHPHRGLNPLKSEGREQAAGIGAGLEAAGRRVPHRVDREAPSAPTLVSVEQLLHKVCEVAGDRARHAHRTATVLAGHPTDFDGHVPNTDLEAPTERIMNMLAAVGHYLGSIDGYLTQIDNAMGVDELNELAMDLRARKEKQSGSVGP